MFMGCFEVILAFQGGMPERPKEGQKAQCFGPGRSGHDRALEGRPRGHDGFDIGRPDRPKATPRGRPWILRIAVLARVAEQQDRSEALEVRRRPELIAVCANHPPNTGWEVFEGGVVAGFLCRQRGCLGVISQ